MLRPCPFCGSTDIGFFEHVFTGDHSVICRGCGGEGPRRMGRDGAVRLWNERLDDHAAQPVKS